MSTTPTSRPFQVHLRGIVELLSRNIYSSPDVFVRELLQNGCDAIAARRDHDPDHRGHIRVIPAAGPGEVFALVDDGAGLTAAEVGEFLAIVGRSSKRDVLDLPRTDRLGQFGIGLLSCFMVSDDITVRTRSLHSDNTVEWVGRADGTFTVTELPADPDAPVGTRVELRPRPDTAHLVTPEAVSRLVDRYGRYLPVTVTLELPGGDETVNRPAVFAESYTEPSSELLELGAELIGAEPFDVIPLSVPGTGTRGTAFVLPFAPPPGAKQAGRVYLGGMLLSERAEDLLPDWAFFTRVVLDTTGLHPTASRESLVDDEALADTREAVGAAIRRWIATLATREPHRLATFLSIHHLALRAHLVHDEELARFLVPWLPVETSAGRTTFGELAAQGVVRYAETVDEFRQLAGIARADAPIVNGGYVYDTEILRMLPDIVAGARTERVTVADEIDALDVPPLSERPTARALQDRADTALADLDCATSVRSFEPAGVPALYVADPQVLRRLRREQGARTGGLWAEVMARIDERADEVDDRPGGRLALNWRNRLVRTLASVRDDTVVNRTVRILYVQSLLAGHRPLRTADRAALTDAMTDIVHLSVGIETTEPTPDEG